MGFAIDKLGQWTEGPEFKVEADRTKAYAAATNDPIPAHLSGEVAPPVFAVVPIWDTIAGAMAGVDAARGAPARRARRAGHAAASSRSRRAWCSARRPRPVGIHVKPNGTTVVAKVETRDQTGELVAEQYMTSFFRGVSDGEGAGEDAPKHKLEGGDEGDRAGRLDHPADRHSTRRTATPRRRATTCRSTSTRRSRSRSGLPGIIIHGLCTMAFTSWAAIQEVCDGDPSRLKRLAVRFSRPVLPGQTITTTFWAAGEADGNAGVRLRDPQRRRRGRDQGRSRRGGSRDRPAAPVRSSPRGGGCPCEPTTTRRRSASCSTRARSIYGAEFAAVLASSRVWVNGDEPADGDATALTDGDEVAVLPPVSGGAAA